MHIVHVIPIARGIELDALSYFSAEPPPEGSVVMIPLRKKSVPALVAGVEDVSASKASLKKSSFALRKISEAAPAPLLTRAALLAARETARFHASSVGGMLAAFTPRAAIELASGIPFSEGQKGGGFSERLIFANREKAISEYRNIVRRSRGSVYFAVPTVASGENLLEALSEFDPLFLHSGLKKSELKKRIPAALSSRAVVGTPGFLMLPFPRLQAIVVHEEDARAYTSPARPYADARLFIRSLCRALAIPLVLSGYPPRFETLHALGASEFPVLSSKNTRLIDMRKKPDGPQSEEKTPFSTLSSEALEIIKNEKCVYVFAARRGLAPLTVCSDCGVPVTCPKCASPMVLHETAKGRLYLCHACGSSRDTRLICSVCGGWNFTMLGVSVDRVRKELEEKIPGRKIFVLSSDTVQSHESARRLSAQFKREGGVLLGTEMALPYLSKIPASIVASGDSILAQPSWRGGERMLGILMRIRENTEGPFLIQTRLPEDAAVIAGASGAFAPFYRTAIAERETLGYPPFRTLILLSLSGGKMRVEKEIENILKLFSPWKPISYPALREGKGGSFSAHVLIRAAQKKWPDDSLIEKLRALPPHVRREINPERIV